MASEVAFTAAGIVINSVIILTLIIGFALSLRLTFASLFLAITGRRGLSGAYPAQSN